MRVAARKLEAPPHRRNRRRRLIFHIQKNHNFHFDHNAAATAAARAVAAARPVPANGAGCPFRASERERPRAER